MKPTSYETVCRVLLERFGEKIGNVPAGQGVNDERHGEPSHGLPSGNRGFGGKFDEAEELHHKGSDPNESYDKNLTDDPALKKKSIIVPDDVKVHIKKYLAAMGLSRKKKRN